MTPILILLSVQTLLIAFHVWRTAITINNDDMIERLIEETKQTHVILNMMVPKR